VSEKLELPETDDYTFGDWLGSTQDLQLAAYGLDWPSFVEDGLLTEEGAVAVITRGSYAAIAEIVEMTDEVGWKPWATGRHVNREAVVREAVDVLHFVGNVLSMVGCSGEELTAAYKAKQLKNLQRQVEGYDGVSSKCPKCRRELSDNTLLGNGRRYCGGCTYDLGPIEPLAEQ
jgi:hypothetical protein